MAYQQGSLDNLCSVYSVINGVEACLEHRGRSIDENARDLFSDLFRKLLDDKKDIHKIMCVDGLRVRAVSSLLETAKRFVYERYSLNLRQKRLPKSLNCSLAEFLRRSDEWCTAGGRVILCTRRPLHWSVIEKVTKSKIVLRDSDGIPDYSVSKCSVDRVTGEPHIRIHESFFIELV